MATPGASRSIPESEPGTCDLIGTSLSPLGFACTLSSALNAIVKGAVTKARGMRMRARTLRRGCAGASGAAGGREAMTGGMERDDEVMMDHRALRRLRRCGGRERANAEEGNERQSGEALSHGITFQLGPCSPARAGEAGACFGPMFSEEMSITYV